MTHDAQVWRLSAIGWMVFLMGILYSGLALPETTSRNVGIGDHGDRPILHFTVLAFRPKPEMLKRWQPVADYLAQKLPSHRIVLEALNYPELDEAVRNRQTDIVLTQPAHYVALSIKENLYSPLATLVELEHGQAVTSFGGVIITTAKNQSIRNLADLKGKRIAASTKESLGGFQAQAFELLEIGIRPDAFQLTATGTQDGVVAALNAGQVDAGFVRTGLLEEMAREGKIAIEQFRVIKANAIPDYPLLLSTRLYPEWALAAMPWVDSSISKKIASAALNLPEDSEVARAAQIRGFTIPGDYRSVDRLMRGLRTPPFDEVVSFTTIWEDHRTLVVLIAIVIGTSIIWVILLRLRGLKDNRLAVAALRESEQHFRTLANGGQALIWTAGTDKQCNYFNDIWLRFTGRTLEQERGNGWTQGVHPDDFNRCLEIYTTSFDNRATFSMEYRLRHNDGSYRWLIDQGNPRYDSSGEFIGYIGYCYDITDRKKAEEEQRHKQAMLERTESVAHVGSWKWLVATDTVTWSDELFHIFQRNPADGAPSFAEHHKLYHPEDLLRLRAAVEVAVSNGTPYELELRAIREDGQTRVCLARSFAEMGPDNRVTILFGSLQDITERKQMELALAESENRFSLFMETLPAAAFIKDEDGVTLFANRYMVEVVGARDWIGKSTWNLFPPALAEKMIADDRRALEDGYVMTEEQVLCTDAQLRSYQTHKFSIPMQGRPPLLGGIGVDITERKQMEMALQTLNETLEQRVQDETAKRMTQEHLMIQQSRMAAMGEMIGNIAHQWRQPLNTLGLVVQNLAIDYKDGFLDQNSMTEYKDTALRSIEKMSQTIDDFRNFFKPNKEKQRFDAADSLDEAIKLVSESFKNNHIDLSVEKCVEPCIMFGYPNEFAQVVLNALSNAKEAIAAKKVIGKVHINMKEGEKSATVIIRDNGGGIPEQIREKVFDPYFTTKEKGTGIGLYMSKMIMDNMGGDISIRNVEGGTEVLLTLPLISDPAV